jgi:hypothetical protein
MSPLPSKEWGRGTRGPWDLLAFRVASTINAKLKKAMNMASRLLNRENILRTPLIRRNSRSISLRRLFIARSLPCPKHAFWR